MQSNIQHLVNSSYREHVSSVIKIREDENGNNIYTEILSYTLKKVGDKIIDKIEWSWASGEIVSDNSYKVTFKCPIEKGSANCKCKNKDKCVEGTVELEGEDIKKYRKENKKEKTIGYFIEIEDHIALEDGLYVIIELDYTIKSDRLYYWSMVEPSKDININVFYPQDHSLDVFVGGLNHNDYKAIHKKEMNNYYFIREGWMLPRAGIAISFYKNSS